MEQLELFEDTAELRGLTHRPRRPAAKSASPRPVFAYDGGALAHDLMKESGVEIELVITDNRSTMMSVKYFNAGRLARVRLHRMFLEAPRAVKTALARWVKNPRAKGPGVILNSYIRESQHLVQRAVPRPRLLVTRGICHDLDALFHELNRTQFQGAVHTAITWGKMPARRRRRSIRFGSYHPQENLIRIHPFLDQAFVPSYFVRYIVFHEMLHALLGIEERPSGRRAIHSREFREREEQYPDFHRAERWIKGNIDRLLKPLTPSVRQHLLDRHGQ